MFEIGDYIIYGKNGVCKVEEVGSISVPGTDKERMYYTLSLIYSSGSKIYTPVDNKKVMMRPIITKEEALKLIDKIPEIDALWVPDDKRREQTYKDALKTSDCSEMIKVIKSLYIRTQSRLEDGKKITAVDKNYLQVTEDILYGELAIPLQMDKSKVETFIKERVNELEEISNEEV